MAQPPPGHYPIYPPIPPPLNPVPVPAYGQHVPWPVPMPMPMTMPGAMPPNPAPPPMYAGAPANPAGSKRRREEGGAAAAEDESSAAKRRAVGQDVIFRIVVPSRQIGKVIGKEGCRIQKIREETKATVKIADAIVVSTVRLLGQFLCGLLRGVVSIFSCA